jgi:periplasmic mercuric ion binding protein
MKTTTKIKSILVSVIILISFTATGFGQQKKDETIKIKTSAVCDECKGRIEGGLAFEKGIKDISLDVDTKVATVKFNPQKTSPEKIRESISKLGYDADDVLADKKAYDKLPACCKKDAPKHK